MDVNLEISLDWKAMDVPLKFMARALILEYMYKEELQLLKIRNSYLLGGSIWSLST